MRRVFYHSLLFVVTVFMNSCSDNYSQPKHATVTGFVYIAGTETPITGVRVSITDKDIPETKLTDENGAFSFENVRTNTYEFNFDKEGYIQVHIPLQVSLNKRNHLDVPMTPIGN